MSPAAAVRAARFGCALLLCLPLAAGAAGSLREAAKPREAVIASAHALATDAGHEIIAAGGNAFDAAVAVSATLGLVEPESSGLGGGSFMLLRTADGREVFIDARERAPLAATRDMYLGADGEPQRQRAVNGALAAAIPGQPAALQHLASKYGRLPLARSLQPALRHARDGWRFGAKNAAMLAHRRDVVARNAAAAALFLPSGAIPEQGALMRNPDYAATLELLSERGASGFYNGDFAQAMVQAVREGGGIWSVEDLARYEIVERQPLSFGFRDWRIVTAPPPSSGGVALAQIFNILGGYDHAALSAVERIHLLAESMRRAYRDRAIYLGDPDHVKLPVDLLTSPEYAAGLRAGINPARATPSDMLPGVAASSGGTDTSHFSIIDRDGNMIAVTQTVNLPYGSAFVVPGTGFVLNNEMDDFSVKPGVPNAFGLVGDDANAIAPGKRPLSSMTPSFLLGDARVAVLGTPGGSRIITMVALAMLELMEGRSAQQATELPRWHHQYLPDVISAEPGAFDAATTAALESRGFTVSAGERSWGNMQIAVWHLGDGSVEAGSDPRWKGVGKGATGSVYQ